MSTEDEVRLEIENVDLRRLLAQAGIDAAELRVVDRLQRLLLEELHHKVKNTLATVMAITTQSLRTATSLEHGREAIEYRLLALGRVHDLLLQTNWTTTALTAILQAAITPFDSAGGGRFFIEASDIQVSSAAVMPLAMVLNELCTNAIKYGALSTPAGRVDITATVDDDHKLFRLGWTESGGPPVKPPTRRSFGTRLIEHGMISQLQGEARLDFAPAGVECVLDIPLASLQLES